MKNFFSLALFLSLLLSSLNGFASATLFCHSKFLLPGGSAQDGGFIFDEAWLNCKTIKGKPFAMILAGGGLSFRYTSSALALSCPLMKKSELADLYASGIRLEAVPLVGARAGVYYEKGKGPCFLAGLSLGIGAGIILDTVEIRPGKICDEGNCPQCCL
ncbi:MAG: hypothetical protein ACOYL6_13720 [Bacteriovoracaceae bacterium]